MNMSRKYNGNTDARIRIALKNKSETHPLVYRIVSLTATYGIPLYALGRYLGVSTALVYRWLDGVTPSEETELLVSPRLRRLENTAHLLDEKFYRPRSWAHALSLCEEDELKTD